MRPLKICALGRRAHRQPLAYEPVRALCADEVDVVDRPGEADVLVVAHPGDVNECFSELGTWSASGDRRILLLSEEPFWDTVWGSSPWERSQIFEQRGQSLPVVCVNHVTSQVFAFDRVPYYLLTSHAFAARYALRFRKNAEYSCGDWNRHFRNCSMQAAFMAERRTADKYDVCIPEHDIRGLASYRTRVAQAYDTGHVLRLGRGWQRGTRRQDLRDWHLDKLHKLAFRCRFVSALENTHQNDYVSEKFFDAFAVGGIPIYFAGANHGVHRIAGHGSWLNLYGLSAEEACSAIDSFAIDDAFLERYRQTQQWLSELFNHPRYLVRERQRLKAGLLRELTVHANGASAPRYQNLTPRPLLDRSSERVIT